FMNESKSTVHGLNSEILWVFARDCCPDGVLNHRQNNRCDFRNAQNACGLVITGREHQLASNRHAGGENSHSAVVCFRKGGRELCRFKLLDISGSRPKIKIVRAEETTKAVGRDARQGTQKS